MSLSEPPGRPYIEHLFHVKHYVNQKPLEARRRPQRLLLIYVGGDGGTFVFFPQFLSLFVGFAALMQAAPDDV